MATGRGFFSQLFIDFVIVGVVIFIVTPRFLLSRHKNLEGSAMYVPPLYCDSLSQSFLGSTINGNSSELLKRWRGKRVLVLNSIGFVAHLQTVRLQRPAEAETDKYSAQDRRHIAGEIGLDRSHPNRSTTASSEQACSGSSSSSPEPNLDCLSKCSPTKCVPFCRPFSGQTALLTPESQSANYALTFAFTAPRVFVGRIRVDKGERKGRLHTRTQPLIAANLFATSF
uniref:Uncharacterized protein 4F11.6 n=1 Tax=Anopheles gambiae TaxID=7165 RepID=Q8T5L0_ANOGA|nr:hypothetical protein [Anopheles gambiae]